MTICQWGFLFEKKFVILHRFSEVKVSGLELHPLSVESEMASLRAGGRELTLALSFETLNSQTYDNYNFLRKRFESAIIVRPERDAGF